MSQTIDPKTLSAAAELGVRLEVMNGLPIWEAQPPYRHQKTVERIASSGRGSPHDLAGAAHPGMRLRARGVTA